MRCNVQISAVHDQCISWEIEAEVQLPSKGSKEPARGQFLGINLTQLSAIRKGKPDVKLHIGEHRYSLASADWSGAFTAVKDTNG